MLGQISLFPQDESREGRITFYLERDEMGTIIKISTRFTLFTVSDLCDGDLVQLAHGILDFCNAAK